MGIHKMKEVDNMNDVKTHSGAVSVLNEEEDLVQSRGNSDIKHTKKEIIQCAIRQNFTQAEWERRKVVLYIALQNCLCKFDD